MPSYSQRAVRKEFKKALRHLLDKGKEPSVTAAAKHLGVTRQAMHRYLKELTTPRADVLRRACEIWDLSLNIDGLRVSRRSFKPVTDIEAVPEQLLLSDVISAIENRDISIVEIRKPAQSSTIEVVLSIQFRKG